MLGVEPTIAFQVIAQIQWIVKESPKTFNNSTICVDQIHFSSLINNIFFLSHFSFEVKWYWVSPSFFAFYESLAHTVDVMLDSIRLIFTLSDVLVAVYCCLLVVICTLLLNSRNDLCNKMIKFFLPFSIFRFSLVFFVECAYQ